MKCIVSLANNRGNYKKALMRLADSCAQYFDGAFLGFINEESVGAPKHLDNPYAFKIYAIDKAIELGYDEILWLDSSCYLVADPKPIFDIIERKGYFMQEAGAWAQDWTNDATKSYFQLDAEPKMPMYSAGITGLNMNDIMAKEFLSQWREAMRHGMFIGSWKNHRHDMSCASIIANRLGFTFEKGDQYVQYGAPEDKLINDSIVIKLQGL